MTAKAEKLISMLITKTNHYFRHDRIPLLSPKWLSWNSKFCKPAASRMLFFNSAKCWIAVYNITSQQMDNEKWVAMTANFDQDTVYPDQGFYDVLQSLHDNAGTIPLSGHNTSFKILSNLHSSITLPFNTIVYIYLQHHKIPDASTKRCNSSLHYTLLMRFQRYKLQGMNKQGLPNRVWF